MLLRLTSSSFGSLLFIRSSVSSTSVEFGSSSGTGLYCVGLITPRVTHKREVAHGNMGTTFPQHKHTLEGSGGTGQGPGEGVWALLRLSDILQELGDILKLSNCHVLIL